MTHSEPASRRGECEHSAQSWYIDRATGRAGCEDCDDATRCKPGPCHYTGPNACVLCGLPLRPPSPHLAQARGER
jgi:hypothetical protein